jgi:hypothetical protein
LTGFDDAASPGEADVVSTLKLVVARDHDVGRVARDDDCRDDREERERGDDEELDDDLDLSMQRVCVVKSRAAGAGIDKGRENSI